MKQAESNRASYNIIKANKVKARRNYRLLHRSYTAAILFLSGERINFTRVLLESIKRISRHELIATYQYNFAAFSSAFRGYFLLFAELMKEFRTCLIKSAGCSY
ncbi:hypothetical protein TcasGA2_TC006011 [Tribolium castaneum]|uniref:Uncharacterized protein n=1 Tax=Tribolium castaneum TaxID=7070 RepID=D6WUK4_TRICA|nr:hypothetical protein TcasGA2_TC006011 [Tribolium castaneum]